MMRKELVFMKFKKIVSLITGALMTFSVIIGIPVKQTEKTLVQSFTAEAAASDFTSKQAVAWANNCAATKWDKDVDGAYGTQCVDLILGYYSYLGVSRSTGNATDYQSNKLPSGWTRVKSSPKPGDVIVWAGGTKINASYTLSKYGHIGIVVAVSGNKLTTVETNADGKVSYAQKVSRDASYAACFIRPNFSDKTHECTDVKTGTYYLKNSSTNSYMQAAGASNKAKLSLTSKKETSAFMLNLTGSKSAGYYLATKLNTGYVVNPFSDNPKDGITINIYQKDNSGTQLWEFDKSGNGYIIHLKSNSNLCITADGTNVILKNRTGAANQVWILESADKQLSGISIATPATKTQYWRNETLQTGGLVLKANYSDGSSKNITSGFTTKYDFSQAGTCVVTISYTENGVTKSTSYNVTVTHPFSGEGTSGNPYIIANKNNLFRLASLINDNKYSNYNTLYYKQTTNIDLNDNEWTPIGIFYESSTSSTLDNNRTFNGNYDGDYHSIIGLKVDYNRNYAGLFGRTNSSAIIENLSVSGSVNGNGACTGGIIGELGYGSKVKNCDFSGTVSGVQCVGGIAGKLHRGGTISTCYVNGVITATGDGASAGGITSTIQIADHANSVNALIENCYFAGKVNASINGALSSDIIIGTVNKSTASFYGNYYLENSANGAVGENEQSGCQKFSSEKLKKAAEYLGYPYVSTGANQNDGYPVFEWQRKFISGDINSDGTVDINDAVLLQKYLLSAESFSAQQFEAADVNNDGSVDVFDMVSMRIILIQ